MAGWTVSMTERFGDLNRVPRIQPYLPARVERLGATTDNPKMSPKEVGKAVKLNGDTVVLCADGDEIYGFVESVEAGTQRGYAIGGVLCDAGQEVLAADEAGSLAVGDLVVAGTPVAIGTAITTAPNVKVRTGAVTTGQSALLSSGGLAIGTSSAAAVKVTNSPYALVGGALVAITGAEVALTGITVATGTSNAIGIFVNAAGTLSAVAGTAAATVAGIVLPQANATRALLGYVIVTNATGSVFTGGSTLLSAANVTDVYIDTVGPIAQADQIAGTHKWQVLNVFGSGAGRSVMLRKV